jgi:hypothetical protein
MTLRDLIAILNKIQFISPVLNDPEVEMASWLSPGGTLAIAPIEDAKIYRDTNTVRLFVGEYKYSKPETKELWTLFHTLWGKAVVGQQGYSKDEWMQLQIILEKICNI